MMHRQVFLNNSSGLFIECKLDIQFLDGMCVQGYFFSSRSERTQLGGIREFLGMAAESFECNLDYSKLTELNHFISRPI